MIRSKLHRQYLAKKDTPSSKDLIAETTVVSPINNEVVDLRQFLGPIRDQGQLGSCTAHAAGAAREFLYRKFTEYEKNQTIPLAQISFSPLYIYYKERELEGNLGTDSGAEIRTSVTAINKFGACTESMDPYDPTDFTVAPTASQEAQAAEYKAGAYHRIVGGLEDLKSVLRSDYPVVVGMQVYQSFEDDYTARTGEMLVPNPDTEECLGGHAILFCGFDEAKQHFIVRNSWGEGWGDKGYFYMNYKIFNIPDLITDMWMVHLGPAWKNPGKQPIKFEEPSVSEEIHSDEYDQHHD